MGLFSPSTFGKPWRASAAYTIQVAHEVSPDYVRGLDLAVYRDSTGCFDFIEGAKMDCKMAGELEDMIRNSLESRFCKQCLEGAASSQLCLRLPAICTAAVCCDTAPEKEPTEDMRVPEDVERSIEAALREGNLEKAISALESFETAEGSPQSQSEHAFRLDDLRPIMTGHPLALHRCPVVELQDARVATAMVALGVKRHRDFPMESRVLIEALVKYGQTQRNLESWRESDCVQSVKITGSDDGPCEECRKLLDRSWGLDDAPELPNPKCTTRGGCRCCLVVDRLVLDGRFPEP